MHPSEFVRWPRLSPLDYIQQGRLIRRAQAGDTQARHLVVLHNLGLILSSANRFNVPLDVMSDVLQEGCVGLDAAIRKYDIERCGELSTYAWHWIRQSISRCIIRQALHVRVPAYLWATYAAFRRQSSRVATRNEWATWWQGRCERDPEGTRLLQQLDSLNTPLPLQAASGVASGEPAPSSRLEGEERGLIVRRCLALMDSRQREVLTRRYGLDGQPPSILLDVAKDLDLSRERVRQIQMEAEARFAELWACDGRPPEIQPLASHLPPPPPPASKAIPAGVPLSAPATGDAWVSTLPDRIVKTPWRAQALIPTDSAADGGMANPTDADGDEAAELPSDPRPAAMIEMRPTGMPTEARAAVGTSPLESEATDFIDDRVLAKYQSWHAAPLPDPFLASDAEVLEGLESIVRVEGPVLCERVYRLYASACGERDLTRHTRDVLDQVVQHGVERGLFMRSDGYGPPSPGNTFIRLAAARSGPPRQLGPRKLAEVEPAELAAAFEHLATARPHAERLSTFAAFARRSDQPERAVGPRPPAASPAPRRATIAVPLLGGRGRARMVIPWGTAEPRRT